MTNNLFNCKELSDQDLEDINYGASLLASGGGGAFSCGKLLVQLVKKAKFQPLLAPINSFSSSDFGAVVCGVGSPDKFAAQVKEGKYESPSIALKALAKVHNRDNDTLDMQFVAANESGDNIFIALLAAVTYGIPLADCNGSGRAVPRMDMLTYSTKLSASPTVAVNELPAVGSKNFSAQVILNAPNMSDMEALLRPLVSIEQFGGVGAIATWAMNGEQLNQKDMVVNGAISQALFLGRKMRNARESEIDVAQEVIEHFDGKAELIFTGHLHAMSSKTEGGFDIGKLVFKGCSIYEGQIMTVLNQNENLICWNNQHDHPIVLAPDLISYLFGKKGLPYTNSDLVSLHHEEGWSADHEVSILRIKPAAELYEPKILEAFNESVSQMGYYGRFQLE